MLHLIVRLNKKRYSITLSDRKIKEIMIKRLALFFLGSSDKFDSSHLLFLLVLITNIFCLNTRARVVDQARTTRANCTSLFFSPLGTLRHVRVYRFDSSFNARTLDHPKIQRETRTADVSQSC